MKQVKLTAKRLNPNAYTRIPMNPNDRTRARVAPNPAPAEVPRISGDTSGFLKIPWYVAPFTASAEPTTIVARIRGMRILNTTVSINPRKLCSFPIILAKTIVNTSLVGIGYRPMHRDRKANTVTRIIKEIYNENGLLQCIEVIRSPLEHIAYCTQKYPNYPFQEYWRVSPLQ